MSRQGEVRLHRHPPGPIDLRARHASQRARETGGRDPGRPDHRARGDPVDRALARPDAHGVRVDVHHGVREQRCDPQALQRARGLRGQRGGKRRQQAVAGLHQQDAGLAGVDRPEVAGGVAGDLADLPGHLHPGRAAAHDHEGQPGGARLRIRLDLRRLEGAQDAGPQVERSLQRLELGSEGLPLVVAEVRVPRAPGHDQGVVGEGRIGCLADLPAHHPASREVEPGDLGHHHPDVAAPLEDGAQRIADLPGRESPGRHLVGQRLEEVEVAPVDERHVDRGAAELLRRLQAPEAAADDDDAMPGFSVGPHRRRLRCGRRLLRIFSAPS